ncbi:tectonic-3 [Indicator indicator]|uniref:tectonic-3 n=1 Tax=Indicator indicator TaxID=1002788 RepID=UPI0023DEE918|nr:tectonic-3 [Indicator indicator]
MRGSWALLLAPLLACLVACSSVAELVAEAARRTAPRGEEVTRAQLSAASSFHVRRLPPAACALRGHGAAASSRWSSSRSLNQVCVENSLVFRSNTPYPTDTVAVPGGHKLLFCVQLNDSTLNYFQQPQDIKESDFLKFLQKYGRYSFLAPSQAQPSFPAFYRAGDPILIYFDSSSVLSTLRQPGAMGASGLCVDGNPAGFLDSKSTSCTRIFTKLSKSCVTDPALDAASYYRDFVVLKVPVADTTVQSMKVKVATAIPPGSPYLEGNTCNNVVSEVIYGIEFSGTHGIQSVSVQFKVSNISGNSGSSLQQQFTLYFWTRTLPHMLPRSGNPGYITGAPLWIASSGAMQHMSILQSEGDGSCSQSLRHTVQFGRNMRTGCKLSLSPALQEGNCSSIQQELYKALQGMTRAEDLAITGSAHSAQAEGWTIILIQNCSVQAANCTSCCMVPVTLEIQILWAKVGFLSNPQAQILGARYFYQCYPLKLLSTSMVPLTTVVTFTDMTGWPEAPGGQPQMHWKLPFDIFFPFKVASNLERSYRDYLAVCFFLILIISGILCF